MKQQIYFQQIVLLLMASMHLNAQNGNTINNNVLYGQETLPTAIRSRIIDNNNGCKMHILEAGFEEEDRPLVVLLHGFPELAYSWRKQLVPLADAGFHVIAPDLRGYGKSSGTNVPFEDDLKPYSLMNNVTDIIGLVYAMGFKEVKVIIGHDYGAAIAGTCALYRPDIFKSLVLMSVPYGGAPKLPFNTAKDSTIQQITKISIPEGLAALPEPRLHYWWYYSRPEMNTEILNCKQELFDFFRAYFHTKSGDYKTHKPYAVSSWQPEELAKLPRTYILDMGKSMPETVHEMMPSTSEVASNTWLTNTELKVYSSIYKETGFQGGAQAYRLITTPGYSYGLAVFTDKKIEVPTRFITGTYDWGPYLTPNALKQMENNSTHFDGSYFLEGAGHMVQQEKSQEVNTLLIEFLKKHP